MNNKCGKHKSRRSLDKQHIPAFSQIAYSPHLKPVHM